ncbi:ABC transporter ATP-binding protein [Sphingomicrobium clamense]|uniref:ABC transporter ATP-binding protein n=1 Tax=Sphingomicrobium clamense TaxID=2851013 RepID=A0ABS6V635_9SPHN|nr:ABC transporter ATP-binding protein [Sphingomicrobium sp. B8]
MSAILAIDGLRKAYAGGTEALKGVSLELDKGEIFALLGPNGAGKTTLISIVCGIVTKTGGTVTVEGHDIETDYRAARSMIGLVPQELTTEAFETVWDTVRFSRGLFGKPSDDAYLETLLKRLTLWDKRKAKIMELSGGMKRRVLIAKALAHEPELLFLDEPTAGVDVELRRDMWDLVRDLQRDGTTIVLTTHYIEEAEEMADRVGVISNGELVAMGRKDELMSQLGQRTFKLFLEQPLEAVPAGLEGWALRLDDDGNTLCYDFDSYAAETGIPQLMRKLDELGIAWRDLTTRQSSLEDIFVSLVKGGRA